MQTKVFTKFGLTIILLLGMAILLIAGPNDKMNAPTFSYSKVMTDFKIIITKNLAHFGLTADLGLTALNPDQIAEKNNLMPPPPPPIVVTSIQDTYIRQDEEDENFGGRNKMEVEYHVGANHDRRGLIKMDLSAYSCVVVESATLYMYLEKDENEGVIIDAFAVNSEWNEGTGNGSNGAVNWDERINGTNWTNAGGDFDPTLLGTMTTEALGYRALSLDVSTVQSWINDPVNNNGIILLGRLDNSKRPEFTTMEGTASQRPYLELTLREACCANGIDDDGDGDIDNVDGDCGGYTTVSTDTPIGIPDDQTATITSTITVAEFGTVTDINVLALDILHDYIGDISITLTSPSGTVVQLRDNGCSSNDNLYLNFDDEGLPYSAIGCPPVDAVNAYQAFGNLNDFNGEEVHGDWTLTVEDNFAEDGGTFLSWTLQYFLGTDTGICGNGLDEDNDGFTDGTDPDCDCGTNYELISVNGNGISTTGSSGVGDVGNATGNADGAFAQVYDGGDRLVIELTEVLGENTEYTLTWRRKNTYTNTATADIVIEESMDGSTWTVNPSVPNTTSTVTFVESNVFTNVDTKFIRLRQQTTSNDDFDFDAITFDTETCQLIAFEICGNGLDDDDDGLIDDADPDCGECSACFTPIVSEFLIPFPEDQVFTALETIFPGDATCGISTSSGGVQAPVFSYISVSAFLDETILFYDHWEDGFESEPSNPTQSTTEIWGDGNLSNGFPPNHPTDIIDAGSILILNNPIDPTTLQGVLDFDGGDAISSSFPLSITRAAWAEGTKTLLAGALEVFSTESWGTYYEIPFGVDVDTDYNYFDYTGFVVMSASDNNSIQIDADADGTYETTITLNKGQSYQANGGVMAGARINATEKVQVDVITGDICDNFESRWFTLPPEEQWEDNYYSPMSDATQVYVVYNPNNTPLTLKVNISGGTLSDVVIPANSTGRFVAAANTGHHLYSSDGSDFYAVVLNDALSTVDDDNSRADWGAALIPQSRLTKQVVVGWAPGQDPTQTQSENGSPIWVTAFYPPGSVDAGSGNISVCIDYDGDGQGPLMDSYGRRYDTSISLADLGNAKVYDPDGNQTNMVLYICDDKEALLSVVWGQENGVASAASPGLDVGTGVPGLNPFFAYKTVALTGDVDNDGEFSLGDTIQYSIGIQNPGLVPVTGNYLVEDIFPNDLNYIQNSTFIDDGTNQMTITDAGTSDFPLDEGGVTLGIALEPRAEAVVSFSARIVGIPNDSLITNYATVTKDGIRYEPKVTIKVNPVSEICDNLIDDDLDGFIDCDCETEDNIIRGIVYHDANENGVNDAENGIEPVIVNVYNDVNGDGILDAGDTQFNTTTTTAEGAYEFAVSGSKLEKRIAATADDAEQDNSVFLGGGTTTNNQDLDLGFGYSGFFDNTVVGLRYPDITIPSGAVITDAFIEFTANSSESGACNMDIFIEASDSAPAYQSTFQNLSNRIVYTTNAEWNNVPNWANNQTYQTPDLAGIIQLVIDRPGWNSGNALSFLIQGTDKREAFSFEDDPNKAPKLVINYAFFPANYIVEIDTTSVQAISAGASFTTPTTQAITFGDPDAFVCDANFGVAYSEICDDGIDNDFDGLIDCDDPDVWGECCLFDEWNYDCDDGICTEIVGVGIKNNIPQTLTFTDPASISHIVIEATFDGGSGHPAEVTFTNGSGLSHTVPSINFDTGNDKYYRAFFNPTDEITLTVPAGTNQNRGETFIAYIFRNCENTASAGAFTHKFLHQNSHTFTFDIPTTTVSRDIEIVVPLSEITNDTRIAQIVATAGPISETITINNFNQGNSLNITPFTLTDVPGDVSQITVEVISPGGGVGQSLYLSGAGSANVVCPVLTLDKRVDDTVFRLGETVTYTYVLYNTGDDVITNLVLNDDKLGNISLPQTTLAVGDSIVVTATHVVDASDFPGGITNVATVTGESGGQNLTDSDTEYIDLIAIDLVKTVDPVNSAIGQTVTYTYEITNNGSIPLELDLVDDKLGNIQIADPTSQDLILMYEFENGTGEVISDVSGFGSPLDLTFENATNHTWGTGEVTANTGTSAINTDTNAKVYTELTASNEITVAAWITPANTTQSGPARIVSSSENTSNRNFTLGQDGGSYNVRLRTTTNGNNGNSLTDLSGGTVTTGLTHVAFTRNAAGTAVLYVNGVAVDTETIAGDFSNWDSSYPFVLFNEATNDRDWLGGMSNVAVYKTALTASEIQDNYNLGAYVNTGRVAPGQTLTVTQDHVITIADAPSPLVNIADVTGTPVNHPKTVTDQDDAEVNFNNPPEICGDGIDNDFDGLTDCDDPDCTTPTVTFSGNMTVCEGESTTITATGNEPTNTYQWSDGLGTGQTKTITPPSDPTINVTTTYSVTVTDVVGCTAVGTFDLTAESAPTATTTFSDEYCNQGNGFITFSFPNHPNRGAIRFSIDGGNTYPYNVQDDAGTFTVDNLSAGTYDLWTRWGNQECPVDLPDVTLANVSAPTVAITGPTEVCEGEQAQISAQATGGTPGYTYVWDNGLGSGSTKTIYPTNATTYNVTATDSRGCTAVDQISITILSPTEPACSDCPNPADDDGDGICESEDCDDDDPNIPAPPGTPCDDGNDKTINDVLQDDGCTCVGDPIPCDIGFNVTVDQPVYDNNGTDNNLSDDTFTFTVLIADDGSGTTWTANGQSGTYGTTATFGPFPVDAAGVSFDIVDAENPNCRENISVNIASCIYSGVCTCCE